MNYQKVYRDIVERGQVRDPDPGVYYETHHIHPRCMGGGDERENITTLTAREHFIAHWLLARIYPDIKGINYAFFCMCNLRSGTHKRDYKISSRTYEEARLSFNRWNSDNMKKIWEDPKMRKEQSERKKEYFLDPENRKKNSAMLKSLWDDPEYRSKMMIVRKEQASDIEKRKEQSDKLKERYKDHSKRKELSEKTKEAMSSPETREKMSDIKRKQLANPEARKKMSKLTEDQVRDIMDLLVNKRMNRKDIAEKYGVSKNTITNLKKGRTYQWIL